MWRRRDRQGKPAAVARDRVVAVTGAAGRVGSACLQALADTGADVIAIDRHSGSGPGEWRLADLHDPGAARTVIRGATHLVHLAGATAPVASDTHDVLIGNATITANVLAAFVSGVPVTAVLASSTSVYGFVWSPSVVVPDYLPVDEDHPCRPADPYSLSKLVIEELAAMWSRSTGLTTVSLRFPWTSGEEPERIRGFVDAIAEDPTSELARRHLWAQVHVDDVADAVVRGLDVADGQAHVVNLAAPGSPGGRRPSELASACFPTVPQSPAWDGDSAYSTERARRLLGWSPLRDLSSRAHPDDAAPR